MNCNSAQSKIDECIKLSGLALPNEVKAHLNSCPECSDYWGELAGLQSMLENSDVSVYPGELDDITFENIAVIASEKIRKIKPAGSRGLDFRWLWAPAAVAAAIIMMVAIPRLTNNGTSNTITMTAPSSITSVEVLNDIARSDNLGDEVFADIAQDIDMDYIAEALLEGSDISDLLYGLTQSEMEALYNKIDNLSGTTGSTGKGGVT